MNELALFAGSGGGILGGKLLGWRTVCAVEIDAYAAGVLAARQNDGCLPPFPIWDDIATFDGKPWRSRVDVVSGGFPCQDISAAGAGAGITGGRSGLWVEMARIIGEVRPRFAFVENSPMLTSRGLGTCLGDLAALGYDARWGVLGAIHAGAPHKRERIWILAHAKSVLGHGGDNHARICMGGKPVSKLGDGGGAQNVANARGGRCGEPGEGKGKLSRGAEVVGASEAVAHAEPARLEGHGGHAGQSQIAEPGHDGASKGSPAWMPCPCCDDWWCNIHGMHTGECPCPPIDEWTSDPYTADANVGHAESISGNDEPIAPYSGGQKLRVQTGGPSGADCGAWWSTEPNVGRVAHGVAARVDRLRAIGNGQVPAVVRLAWHLLHDPES